MIFYYHSFALHEYQIYGTLLTEFNEEKMCLFEVAALIKIK
jgi:hypothetical protein